MRLALARTIPWLRSPHLRSAPATRAGRSLIGRGSQHQVGLAATIAEARSRNAEREVNRSEEGIRTLLPRAWQAIRRWFRFALFAVQRSLVSQREDSSCVVAQNRGVLF
jgi:hypothetical protein